MVSRTEISETKRQTTAEGSQFRNVDRLLEIKEVSYVTGLAVGTLYHFVSQKRVPVVRLSKRCIRFRESDLSDWIQTLTQKAR
jgi:predicted DNA-binding transcriptional regulator AlpA